MEQTPSQAFGQAVRETRKAKGMSQEACALECGIDRAYMGHIERGSKSATLDTIWKIAEGLETEPSILLARAEDLPDS